MQVVRQDKCRPVKVWANWDDVESTAKEQIMSLASLPFISKHGVAIMPDVHAGKGSTIGSVIATRSAIIPAAVGVDIGCGMLAVKTSLKASDLPTSLLSLRHAIEAVVPCGTGRQHRDPLFTNLLEKTRDTMLSWNKNALYQLGTLGSGNHFIEICLDTDQNVWIMLHSGSRGLGNKIGTYFTELAIREAEKWGVCLDDKHQAFLPESTSHFSAYWDAMVMAQEYASLNRQLMLEQLTKVMKEYFPTMEYVESVINCHHNYASMEWHYGEELIITRKGAVAAFKGEKGIIPGSMGQKSYIVVGKGNRESYCSCSHGAGRVMSRTKAKATFTVDDLTKQTEGVECRKDERIIDEIPSAYKDIDAVMEHQKDLVDVVATLKAVLCIKGD